MSHDRQPNRTDRVTQPKTAIFRHGLSQRVILWLAILYVVGGIALPIVYLSSHMRFHDGPPFFVYFLYFIVWSIPLHALSRREAKSVQLRAAQHSLGTLGITPHPVLFQDQPISIQRRSIRIEFGIAAFFLAAGLSGAGLIHVIGSRGAGTTLRVYPMQELVAADPAKVPAYIRLEGGVAHPDLAGARDYTIKTSHYRDYYMPRTLPGWNSNDAVAVIELDNTFPDNPPDPDYAFNPPGAVEGELESVTLPRDMASAFGTLGWKTATPIYVLTRKRLGGVVPGADAIGEVMTALIGVLLAVMFGGIALFQKRLIDSRLVRFGQRGDHVGVDPDTYTPQAMATLGLPSRWLCHLVPHHALVQLSDHIVLALLFWPALAVNIALVPVFPITAIALYLALGIIADWIRGRRYRAGLKGWPR